MDVSHSRGTDPSFMILLNRAVISCWSLSSPYFNILFVMLSSPDAFLFFELIIDFLTSSNVMCSSSYITTLRSIYLKCIVHVSRLIVFICISSFIGFFLFRSILHIFFGPPYRSCSMLFENFSQYLFFRLFILLLILFLTSLYLLYSCCDLLFLYFKHASLFFPARVFIFSVNFRFIISIFIRLHPFYAYDFCDAVDYICSYFLPRLVNIILFFDVVFVYFSCQPILV